MKINNCGLAIIITITMNINNNNNNKMKMKIDNKPKKICFYPKILNGTPTPIIMIFYNKAVIS